MRIKKKILDENKGEGGIGTFIIFIAIALIAGLVGIMFIYSGGILKDNAIKASDNVTKQSSEEERLTNWMDNVDKIDIRTPKPTPTPSNTSTPAPTPTNTSK